MNRTVLSILAVRPSRIGGQEALCREITRQLGERGWRHVMCWADLPQGAVLDYLSLPNAGFEALSGTSELAWAPAKGVWSLLRKHRPAILHLHYTGFLSPYPWLGRLASVRRVMFTDQSSRPEGYEPRRAPAWKRMLWRGVNAHLDCVVAVSGYNRSDGVTMDLLPAERYHTIYNSVDLSRIRHTGHGGAFRRRFGIPEDRKVVLQVSWIIPEKGIEDVLEAARLVHLERNDVQFVLVGEGKERTAFTRMAQAMGLGNHVTFTGQIVDPLNEGVFEAPDIVCQLSRWQEAFGWVIAEGMAFCKPVVVSDAGGIPEIVEDGVSGYVVPRRDPQAAAQRMLHLLAHPERARKMGQAARQAVESKFELTQNVKRLIDLYHLSAL
jgi:glycosyltransferase involved in cell wall biosynthesis